jgi:prephenate dehydratase
MKIAFQGEIGAYSEEAIIATYGGKVTPVPRPYLRDVFDSVEAGEANSGLIPVENTIEGSIVRTYDLLNERSLKAGGEAIHRIVHCLIANPGVKLEEIKKVYSHPQALGQCRKFLEKHSLEAVPSYDTAGSVKILKNLNVKDSAAIASGRAAEVYGMEVLRRGIETHQENYTRFLLVKSEDHERTGDDKTSIAFIVDHKPGSLFQALGTFADSGINLTKIESRPQLGAPWEYVFFIDIQGHRLDKEIGNALDILGNYARSVKILGSYPRAKR